VSGDLHARRPARSRRLTLRGLDQHVLAWGDADAPPLVLLHGWMDCAASFQFLVDAFARERHVVAPDLRGFGRSGWQSDGYWFLDYVADLDALVDALAPAGAIDLVGHSLGGNVAMLYGGVRPARVRRLVSLEGFGIPDEPSSRAPDKVTAWLDALRKPPGFAPYASLAAVADRLQKNDPRLTRDRALWLAPHWARAEADGSATLVSDPRHKLPFPTVYHFADAVAVWTRIEAPVLWVAGGVSTIPRWLAGQPEGEGAVDGLDAVRARMASVPGARLAVIDGAGHMLHHDEPEAVARAIESFLDAP